VAGGGVPVRLGAVLIVACTVGAPIVGAARAVRLGVGDGGAEDAHEPVAPDVGAAPTGGVSPVNRIRP
jgi:hypothetical protein